MIFFFFYVTNNDLLHTFWVRANSSCKSPNPHNTSNPSHQKNTIFCQIFKNSPWHLMLTFRTMGFPSLFGVFPILIFWTSDYINYVSFLFLWTRWEKISRDYAQMMRVYYIKNDNVYCINEALSFLRTKWGTEIR